MAGEIVHIEIPSGDFTRSAAFYGKLFGWRSDGAQSGGHLVFDLPGGVRGSWIREALAQAAGPVPFVAVADVAGTLAEAERQGGRVLVRRLQLASLGAFGLIADCDGNVIGVLESAAADHAPKPSAAVPEKAAPPSPGPKAAAAAARAISKPATGKPAAASKPAKRQASRRR